MKTKSRDNFDRSTWQPVLIKNPKSIPHRSWVIDQYLDQLEEVFLLNNPQYRFNSNYANDFQKFLAQHKNGKSLDQCGNWFYFPWSKSSIHYLKEDLHQKLRTGRNQNLITEQEQEKFYGARVGVLGMSVGSHVVLTIAMTGGGKNLKLADPDKISGSNLNRIRSGFQTLGVPKTFAVARQIFEINPYSKIQVYSDGVNDVNLEDFLLGGGKLDLLVEEMDNPYLKIKSRFLARKYGIPVIMAADSGDNIIVDIERYDLNHKLKILNGLIGSKSPDDFKNIPPAELPKVIASIAGADLTTLRMLKSVIEVGKTLYSWPQLGNAATLCGAVLSNIGRRVILKENIKSGRYHIDIDNFFMKESTMIKKEKSNILRNLSINGH